MDGINLGRLFLYFCMPLNEYLESNKPLCSPTGLCICLAVNLYSLTLGKVDAFGDERIVERV